MTKEKIIQILDKNIDQQGLVKDLAAELVIPELLKVKQDILDKKIDLVPGTTIDNEVLAKVVDKIIEQIQKV